uniref:Putative secreted protein n=1 Tax=Ixodes ricinus TaxID=34613 RepID=A0A6B0U335_IXORI
MTSVLVSLFWLYLGSSADSFLLSLNHIISRPGFSVELHWSTSDLDRGSRRIPLPGISSLVWTAFTLSKCIRGHTSASTRCQEKKLISQS